MQRLEEEKSVEKGEDENMHRNTTRRERGQEGYRLWSRLLWSKMKIETPADYLLLVVL
jgi:hypothetical protein